MASLREIRRKIQSVKSTQQITRAMKMVAAARMRKAQSGILDSRPFAVKMEGTVSELAALELEAGTLGATCVCARRFFGIPAPEGAAPEAGAAGLLLVTADKGLCGAFNANLLRAALRWIRNQQGRRIAAAAVGRKGREFLRRISDLDIEFLTELTGIFPKVSFAHAELVARAWQLWGASAIVANGTIAVGMLCPNPSLPQPSGASSLPSRSASASPSPPSSRR